MNTLIFIALYAAILPAMLGFVIIGLAIYGQRKKRKLLFWVLSPVVAFAWVCDLLLNVLLHMALRDVRGYTITQRLKHYLAEETGKRRDLALAFQPAINYLDEGHLPEAKGRNG